MWWATTTGRLRTVRVVPPTPRLLERKYATLEKKAVETRDLDLEGFICRILSLVVT